MCDRSENEGCFMATTAYRERVLQVCAESGNVNGLRCDPRAGARSTGHGPPGPRWRPRSGRACRWPRRWRGAGRGGYGSGTRWMWPRSVERRLSFDGVTSRVPSRSRRNW